MYFSCCSCPRLLHRALRAHVTLVIRPKTCLKFSQHSTFLCRNSKTGRFPREQILVPCDEVICKSLHVMRLLSVSVDSCVSLTLKREARAEAERGFTGVRRNTFHQTRAYVVFVLNTFIKSVLCLVSKLSHLSNMFSMI